MTYQIPAWPELEETMKYLHDKNDELREQVKALEQENGEVNRQMTERMIKQQKAYEERIRQLKARPLATRAEVMEVIEDVLIYHVVERFGTPIDKRLLSHIGDAYLENIRSRLEALAPAPAVAASADLEGFTESQKPIILEALVDDLLLTANKIHGGTPSKVYDKAEVLKRLLRERPIKPIEAPSDIEAVIDDARETVWKESESKSDRGSPKAQERLWGIIELRKEIKRLLRVRGVTAPAPQAEAFDARALLVGYINWIEEVNDCAATRNLDNFLKKYLRSEPKVEGPPADSGLYRVLKEFVNGHPEMARFSMEGAYEALEAFENNRRPAKSIGSLNLSQRERIIQLTYEPMCIDTMRTIEGICKEPPAAASADLEALVDEAYGVATCYAIGRADDDGEWTNHQRDASLETAQVLRDELHDLLRERGVTALVMKSIEWEECPNCHQNYIAGTEHECFKTSSGRVTMRKSDITPTMSQQESVTAPAPQAEAFGARALLVKFDEWWCAKRERGERILTMREEAEIFLKEHPRPKPKPTFELKARLMHFMGWREERDGEDFEDVVEDYLRHHGLDALPEPKPTRGFSPRQIEALFSEVIKSAYDTYDDGEEARGAIFYVEGIFRAELKALKVPEPPVADFEQLAKFITEIETRSRQVILDHPCDARHDKFRNYGVNIFGREAREQLEDFLEGCGAGGQNKEGGGGK